MNDILLGAIAMASMVAALFFLRFWRSTHDRFFLFFALSFLIEALNRVFLVPNSMSSEDVPEYYLVRLLSYALILFAIWDKNRPSRK
ncbi:MAG TPA: DUF5985 family protein [Noviherbaspirillum sp.]|jgi:hypothetical protein|uniref:DUF5985 family protein n=1 Tax=Noviherbaspirillum sp. TaxID=1926288 RepID=UPI002DDDA343|nr:DUF5985 family protein [Noviherbaspirillum sp.]HEV2610439.1 DUF5985 family protein [Noviherbaspirillum sp.]